MTRINFRPIDAKDYRFCAKIQLPEGGYGPNNYRLQILLEREYLTRLAALQEELKAKYLPQIDTAEISTLGHDERHEVYVAESHGLFPGNEANYYD